MKLNVRICQFKNVSTVTSGTSNHKKGTVDRYNSNFGAGKMNFKELKLTGEFGILIVIENDFLGNSLFFYCIFFYIKFMNNF